MTNGVFERIDLVQVTVPSDSANCEAFLSGFHFEFGYCIDCCYYFYYTTILPHTRWLEKFGLKASGTDNF